MTPTAAVVAIKWRKRGSWHLMESIETALLADGPTFCGRYSKGTVTLTRSEPPGNEKTCERCFVIAQKRA